MFTQHYTGRQVHAFSQPLVVDSPDDPVVSTPTRPAYILRLDPNGPRAMAPIRSRVPGRAYAFGAIARFRGCSSLLIAGQRLAFSEKLCQQRILHRNAVRVAHALPDVSVEFG